MKLRYVWRFTTAKNGKYTLSAQFENQFWERGFEMSQRQINRAVSEITSAKINEIEVEEFDNSVIVIGANRPLATWESKLAFNTDITSHKILSQDESQYTSMEKELKGKVLVSIRAAFDKCPSCKSNLEFSAEDAGCCGDSTAFSSYCSECDEVLAHQSINNG